jgi:excisionase family DNA binding protein
VVDGKRAVPNGTALDQMDKKPKRPPIESPFLTIGEVATYYRVSSQTVYRLVKRGEIHAVRLGPNGEWRIQKAGLTGFNWLSAPSPRSLP